jgi:hypothetical protein
MPDIEKSLFSGQENISTAEWATLTIPDMSDANVSEFLEGSGWDGNVAGVVGLQLAADNSRPTAARFALAGRWSDRPNRIQAQKIFADAPADWLLEINLPNMGLFHFADGSMVSEYVGGDALECHFYTVVDGEKTGVDDELLGEKGISYFTLRAVCSLAKTCGAKWWMWTTVTILIFPECLDAMVQISPAATEAAWPGVKFCEGDVKILPEAGRGKTALNGKAWGSPIAPALIVGAPWAEAGGTLKPTDVRAAIGKLLNAGSLADSSLNEESMRKKWAKIQRAPDSMKAKKPEKTWPKMTANIGAVAKSGQSKYIQT